MHFILTCGKQH